MPKLHRYTVQTAWSSAQGTSRYDAYSRNHTVHVANKVDIGASSDPSFRGDPARHNPEELFVASLSSCHMLWYLHLCSVNGIVVMDYVDDAIGTMEETANGSGRFTDVLLQPRIELASGDAALAEKLHEDAHRFCFIANSVNFPVRCQPLSAVVRPPALRD